MDLFERFVYTGVISMVKEIDRGVGEAAMKIIGPFNLSVKIFCRCL